MSIGIIIIGVCILVALVVFGIVTAKKWWRRPKPGFSQDEFGAMATSIRSSLSNSEYTKHVTMTSSGRVGFRFEFQNTDQSWSSKNTEQYIDKICSTSYPLKKIRYETTNGTTTLEYVKHTPPVHPKIGFFLLIGGAMCFSMALFYLII